ncbi:MAG TPA: hypothetical protein G4O19_03145 [Dehalococcoidia bacterium]|nr:hypothetical protein [Dehalococcoidia bacterium]
MTKPTCQDANIMLQLTQLYMTGGLPEALNWLFSDQFTPDYADFRKKYPPNSAGNIKAQKICAYFETVGTLWKHKLINEELLFDWFSVSAVWKRAKAYALGWRKQSGEQRLYENFESMAKAHMKWQDQVG